MDSNVIGLTSTAGTTSNANRYAPLVCSAVAIDSSPGPAQNVMSHSGTLSSLYVNIDTAAGVGITRTIAVYKNGVQQSLAVALNNTTSGSDTVNSVSFVAGDTLSIVTNATAATANTGTIRWSLKMTAAANISSLMANSGSNASNSVTTYMSLQGSNSDTTASANVAQVFPTAGTLKNAYVVLNNAPTAGKSYALTLFKNGIATTITATVSDANTTATDTTNSVTVAAGDILYWAIVPSGTPTARMVSVSLEFDPTINGESVQLYGSNVPPSATAARYLTLTGSSSSMNANESAKTGLTQAVMWKKMYAAYDVAPGVGTQYQQQLSINGVAGNPTVTIAGTNTTGNDTVNTITTGGGDLVSTKITPTGTPATAINPKVSYVNTFIPQPVSEGSMFMVLGGI
jgi:hypothetical protein